MNMHPRSDRLRGALIGAGYFSQFHLDAWARVPDAEIVAVCDTDETRARDAARRAGAAGVYSAVDDLFSRESLDFVDIATPPASHLDLCARAGAAGIHVLC